MVVLLKVSSVYAEVWQFLHEKNLLREAWIVENVTLPQQRIYTDLVPDLTLSYFSVLIVKKT